MVLSVKFFKAKRFFENFFDFLKNYFITIGIFFKKIVYHQKTEQFGMKIKKVKQKIIYNLSENKENVKKRNFEDHGFRIEDEDT